jgi:hypothetical protein
MRAAACCGYHHEMPRTNGESEATRVAAFIQRWRGVEASELSTAQSFVLELCDLLEVPRPHPTASQEYMFERPVVFQHGDGSTSSGRIDCYRKGCFVLEAKKLRERGSAGFDDALLRARSQAEGYARALPGSEGRPPFLIVVDVGNVIELYSEFSRTGGTYTPYPDPRSHRIPLEAITSPQTREQLRAVWLDPESLDPTKRSARVTQDVSKRLADLARSLEEAGNRPAHVAAFLTRCLFSMFAEDVELLPKGSFLHLLERHRLDPPNLVNMLRALWAEMDHGGFSAALAQSVLQFNGKLFKGPDSAGYSLPLTQGQIELLIGAARCNWREVEPAIFGTLLERALDPSERHKFGAHFTPRAYVERLVLPTIIQPLRAEWAYAQAVALIHANDGRLGDARQEVRRFHHRLCTARVLDPACGSGNFLYVTLEHMKRLEGEVLNQLQQFGEAQERLSLEGQSVTLQQLRGIELNPRAAALAELVLWIGFLQWQIRTRGNRAVAEPVIHDYGNIECRDAVLAWDRTVHARDKRGQEILTWDRRTFKPHPVTGRPVPDETALVPQLEYVGAAPATWPAAEYIVGNPPFIGARKLRPALGDGYVEALRAAYPDVPSTVDVVAYWWHKAAQLVSSGQARRFGLITTNSIVQSYTRPLLDKHLAQDSNLMLAFAIADHPWVQDGAAVRVSMTVGCAKGDADEAVIGTVVEESDEPEKVRLSLQSVPFIGPSLTSVSVEGDVKPLRANAGMCFQGVVPAGDGFKLSAEDLPKLGLREDALPDCVRPYLIGHDLAQLPERRYIIDLFGLEEEEVRRRWPALYERLLLHVKPERDQNPRPVYRRLWWIFAEPRPAMRRALAGLRRYIGTPYTAKHRFFTFVDGQYLPDAMIYPIASDDALILGVLSSSVHQFWCARFGGTLEDRPRYNSKRTFLPFPFPDIDTGLTPALRDRIRQLAEEIDAHRKRQQALHADLALTDAYNVLAVLRGVEQRELTAKEKRTHEQILLGSLQQLHDALDVAVAQAYGLDGTSTDGWKAQLMEIDLRRSQEESSGVVRWLRADLQAAGAEAAVQVEAQLEESPAAATSQPTSASALPRVSWPRELPDQVRAVAEVLSANGRALTLDEIGGRFTGRGPWRRSLPAILQTLEAVGKARTVGERWSGAQ